MLPYSVSNVPWDTEYSYQIFWPDYRKAGPHNYSYNSDDIELAMSASFFLNVSSFCVGNTY